MFQNCEQIDNNVALLKKSVLTYKNRNDFASDLYFAVLLK